MVKNALLYKLCIFYFLSPQGLILLTIKYFLHNFNRNQSVNNHYKYNKLYGQI